MTKRIKVELTEKQLADIIVCLSHCIDKGLGYGHIPEYEHSLPEWNRLRLQVKLEKILPPKKTSTPFMLGGTKDPVPPKEARAHKNHYRAVNYGRG